MVDGKRIGIASNLTSRLHRVDSVSIVSRQSLLPILLLCLTLFLGVGNAWGADPTKTETFESATVSTTYNSTKTITTSQSSCGIEWSIYYGSPSTTQAITGTNSCLIRYYTADAKLGYAKTTTAIKGLKNVTFNAKVTNTGNKMGVWYSTDGNTWTSIASDVVLTTSSQSKSYDIPSSSVSTDYYIKIGLTTGCSTNKKDLIIDDVVFTYASNTPSYTITAQTNNNSLGLVSKSGSVITGTPSTCCEYASPAYTVSPEGKATVTQGTGNKINEFTVSSLTDDVTVTINFQAKNPGKTVKFDAGAGNYTGDDLTEDCVGSGITLPSATATSICKGWTTFAGWATSAVTDSSTTEVTLCSSPYVPNTNNQILYAVYSKDKSGASSTETIAAADLGVSNSTAIGTKTVGTITIKGEQGNNGTSTNVPKYYSAESSIRCYASNDLTISSTNTISQIDFTYDGSYNGGTITPNSGAWASTATTNWDQTWQGSTTSVKFRVGNSQWRVTNIKVTTGGGSTTYYVSDPNCCTELSSINGSVIVNQTPTSVQLSWNAVDGAEKYQVKVPGSTSHNDWTDATSGVTVTGLACGTAHTAYFRAIDTNGSHCSEGPESTLAIPAQSWTVTSTSVTNVTASPAIPSTTCNGFSTTLTAATGYALPSEITVTNADKTWNSSTGALTISNVTGNVTITIAGTCVAPDITGHPASANYVADPVAAATALSVTASAAGADLDYQWQSKVGEGAWTNIQGATNSTYTPSRTTAGVTQYRVVLTNHTCSESSNSNAATITVTVPSVCIAPTFDPEEGTYTGTQSVVLASETTGATVYYTMTTDGSEPATPTSGSTAYSSAISVTENTRIKAIAIKVGMQASTVEEAEYIIKCETPEISPEADTYTGTKSVTITCATDDATIYYSTDGSTPDNTKTEYKGAFNVANNLTVKAIAIKSNMANSDVASAAYLIKCETPVISPATGTHTGAQDVTITCATDDATIYYTTDGSTPDNTKTEYTGSFKITSSKTVKAIAIKSGMENSAIASAAYTIKYTLTFQNNGVTLVSGGTKILAPGEAYGTLPTLTAGDACDATSTTFMGWTTESILEKQASAPASYASATSVMGAGNVVLNAVWAKTKTPGVEPVSITSFATGTYYLIDKQGDNYYAMSGTGTSSISGVDVTDYVSYNTTTKRITITDESEMTAAMKYTISGTTSAAKIYNANKSAWVSTQSSGTSFSTSESSNVVTTHSTDPRFAFSFADFSSSNSRCILYRSSQSGFCNYSTANMNASSYGTGYLWLVTVGSPAVYEDYLTSCCTDWSESAPAISYSTPDHWKAGDDDVAVTIATGDTYGAVSFESSDESVLTVDAATGAIHAVAMGTATVTATWAGGVVDAVRYCSASSSVEVAVSGTVTVSFDGNDATSGTMTDQVIYYNEATALKANAFSKDGFDFYGWAETEEKADAGNRDYEGGETVTFTTDKTLYAVWQTSVNDLTLTQPTVSAVAAGTITANGSTTSPTSIAYGVEVTLAASENSTAVDGYAFDNWSVSGITLADATENPVVFTMPDNDVAVAAVYHHYTWDLTGYTVTTAPETLYSNGDHFDKSSVVIKAGYERSDNSSTKQVTLDAAEWTAKLDGSVIANNYTFALADNGKTLTLWVDETKVGEDYVLTVNAIPTDHFVINIWTSEISPIADKTSAYSMPSLSNQTAGAAATCKDHNLFVGWVEELHKDEPEGHIVAANTAMTPSNKTYYAVWAKTGTITESISYGWEVGDSKDGWTINGTNTNSTYKNSGAKSGSFSTAGNCIKTSSYYASPKSIKAYVTKATTNTNTSNLFRLEYSATGADNSWSTIASSDDFSDMSRGVFEELSANLTSYTNKYFRIFFANASAEGLVDDVEFVYDIQGPVDYITDCVQRYQITFDANGGTGSYDAIEKKEGVTVTLPDGSALSRAAEHYHFNGWKVYNTSTEEEISVSENQFTMPGAAVNAVAQWEEDPKGTVRYVGDEILNSSITRYAGQTYNLRTDVTLPANRKLVGWMLEGDETLYAPGREMTMPSPVQDYTYNVQIIDQLPKPSGVSFSDGEWVLVTNSNQLSAGDFVVIVANGLTNAMGTQANTNRGIASVTKHNEGQTITLTENVAKLFLQYGYREGEFALYDMAENGYLYASSNTSNDLKTSATYSNRNYSWLITIGEGNIASIVAKGANSHNNLKYNTSASVFSSYASGQAAIQLYRYDGHKTVEITENVNASAIYIDDADVVVKDGKTLTIDIASDLDNLTVEAGGAVSGSATLNVNNLTIESEPSKSGQVTSSNTHVSGDIYLEIKLLGDGTGTMTQEESQMWYCISAPFEVSFNDGFFWGNGTPMGHNVDFQAFIFDGAKRASTGVSGWQRVSGKLEAGRAYLIGFDDERSNQKTIRLKAMSNTIPTASSLPTEAHYNEDNAQANWNGVGNPTLHYIALDGFAGMVQCYNNGAGYSPYNPAMNNYVVGTALFMQAENNIDLKAATNANFRAPKRESEENENYSFCVEIAKEGATRCDNRLYVSTSDEATSTYEQGKDMQSMNGTSAKFAALIWTENYGMRLASEDVPMVNKQATYTLGIYAPKAGTYSISTVEASEDAELYLTYNGRAIWNLSMSECELELAQGQNAGYGLRLVVKAPSVVTGIDEINAETSVQKVIIDEHVYILRGGQMYDVNGKLVK